MRLYNSEHPFSNGLEVCLDADSRDWPTLFALVAERLQRIDLELRDAKQEIAESRPIEACGAYIQGVTCNCRSKEGEL
jgi:hypothetical protein